MDIIPKELTMKYAQGKYPMSTGSDEWQDIKADFEIEDDALAGTSMHADYKSIGFDKINSFKLNLEKFRTRIDDYHTRNELESKEKTILQNKIDIGLEIYKMILKNVK